MLWLLHPAEQRKQYVPCQGQRPADFEKRFGMHHQRLHWIQVGLAILLLMALPACIRSASTAMTPLPSAPPPTPTDIPPTSTPLVMEPTASEPAAATEEEISQPVATASPTETPQRETATATKAVVTTEASCGKVLPSRLHVDSYAYVNPDPPVPNNVRSEAGQNNDLLGDIQPGQAMKILDGPKCVDGWLWWKVSPLNNGDLIGWTAESDEQTYWLIPCSSEKDCGS